MMLSISVILLFADASLLAVEEPLPDPIAVDLEKLSMHTPNDERSPLLMQLQPNKREFHMVSLYPSSILSAMERQALPKEGETLVGTLRESQSFQTSLGYFGATMLEG